MNDFTEGGDCEIQTLRIDPALERKQIDRVRAVKSRRETAAFEHPLADLKAGASGDRNLMLAPLTAARHHCTEGEIVTALQDVWGAYTETPVF